MSAPALGPAAAVTGLAGGSRPPRLSLPQVKAGTGTGATTRGTTNPSPRAHANARRALHSQSVSCSVCFSHGKGTQTGRGFGPARAVPSGQTHSGDVRRSFRARAGTGSQSRGRGAGARASASPGEAAGGGATEEAELKRIAETMGERRAVDRSETLSENPYAPVESAMTAPAVTTTPDTLVSSLLDSFQHFTGLPVVDEKGRCVGIISSVDVFEHQRKASPSITDVKVKDVMSTPALVIIKHAPIAYAAGLMLKHKVHRLPVVDNTEDMRVLGIVTRTDIYEPLLPPVNPLFHQLAGTSSSSGDSLGGY